MKVLLATQHFFAPNYRLAGVHQFARALARRGHHIDFVTVGQSWMKQWSKPQIRSYAKAAARAVREGSNPANISAHINRELIHPPSGTARANRISAPLGWFYGRWVDREFAYAAKNADVIILECGYPLYFFEALKRHNPGARFVAFYMDRLEFVGFRPEILALHERLMPRFDLVRTNSERLLDLLPAGSRGRYLPQGVDKERIRWDAPSPYSPGTRNIVSVGDMLFDAPAVRAIAAAAGAHGTYVHVLGARMADPPDNVVVHGEMPFERTLPYILHADVGLAPYRVVAGAEYLAQSSLKIQQYSYCGLPILLARGLEIVGPNFVHYDADLRSDIETAVERALSMPKDRSYGAGVMDWDEVGGQFETLLTDIR